MPPETTDCDPVTRAALKSLPSIPRDDRGPVFDAPWQAQAFAMTLTLQQRGIFTWAEWAEMLGAARARAAAPGAPDTSESYYQDWLATLERMVTAKRLADEAALNRTRDAWDRAAERTPHGTPIELRAGDFSPDRL
jgi:nitrile hydratase accessory protein